MKAEVIINWAKEKWGDKIMPRWEDIPYKDRIGARCVHCQKFAWVHPLGACEGKEGWKHHLKAYLGLNQL